MGMPLEEYMDNPYDSAPVDDNRFMIDTADKADWAIRKINRYQKTITDAKATAQAQIDRINEWLAKETEENQAQINFFQGMLAPFAMAQLDGTKKRSLKLPNGTIGFRKPKTKFEIDEKALLPWAKDNAPDFVSTIMVESVKWAEMKETVSVKDGKAISNDGEVIPGISATEPPDVFYVKGE